MHLPNPFDADLPLCLGFLLTLAYIFVPLILLGIIVGLVWIVADKNLPPIRETLRRKTEPLIAPRCPACQRRAWPVETREPWPDQPTWTGMFTATPYHHKVRVTRACPECNYCTVRDLEWWT